MHTNSKWICRGTFLFLILPTAVSFFFAGYLLDNDSGQPSDIRLDSQEDLEALTWILYEEMLRTGITLTNDDIGVLTAPDKHADVYLMYPNQGKNLHGQGNSSTTKHFYIDHDNGTRIYKKYTHNDELLKYFQINDEPEKRVTIIIKE